MYKYLQKWECKMRWIGKLTVSNCNFTNEVEKLERITWNLWWKMCAMIRKNKSQENLTWAREIENIKISAVSLYKNVLKKDEIFK